MNKRSISTIVWKERGLYVAKSTVFEIASQGKSKREALKNLQEAIKLYLF